MYKRSTYSTSAQQHIKHDECEVKQGLSNLTVDRSKLAAFKFKGNGMNGNNAEEDNGKLESKDYTGEKKEDEPDVQVSEASKLSSIDEEMKQVTTFFIGDENDEQKCNNFYIGDEDEVKTKPGKGLRAEFPFLRSVTGKVDYSRYNFMNEHNAGDAGNNFTGGDKTSTTTEYR